MQLAQKVIQRYLALAAAVAIDVLAVDARAQTLNGVTVGAPPVTLQALKFQQLSRAGNGSVKTTKFRLQNGNDLSVTYDSRANSILYVEADWNLKAESRVVGASDLMFGVTNLEDIRRSNQSNGFSWKQVFMQRIGSDIVSFNAYEIARSQSSIVVYVTAVDIREFQAAGGDAKQFPSLSKLRAVIVANEAYLDSLWGDEKIYDGASKPIRWKD